MTTMAFWDACLDGVTFRISGSRSLMLNHKWWKSFITMTCCNAHTIIIASAILWWSKFASEGIMVPGVRDNQWIIQKVKLQMVFKLRLFIIQYMHEISEEACTWDAENYGKVDNVENYL